MGAAVRAPGDLACHAPLLRAVAWALCRSAADCDDLVQETFLHALRHLADGKPVLHARAWLVSILRNTFIDRMRAKRPMTAKIDDVLANEPELPPAWAHITLADVRAAAAALDPCLRTVFELHYLEGLRYREIASRLGVPENTVASRLFRARKAMRDRLLAPAASDDDATLP